MSSSGAGAALAPRNHARAVGEGELFLNVADFGAVGDGVADDGGAFSAAVAAIPAGASATIYVPPCAAYYNIITPVAMKSYVTWRGDGRKTIIRSSVGDIFTISSTCYSNTFTGLQFFATTGNIFNLGAVGSMIEYTFTNCSFVIYRTATVAYLNGSGNFIENLWDQCSFSRDNSSTSPAFNLTNTTGGLGSNTWRQCRVTSNNVASYFWSIIQTGSGGFSYENTFESITGELNAGGFLYMESPYGVTIRNVVDNDNTGAYTSSLFKFAKNATGGNVGPIYIQNAGNRGGTVNGTNVFHVEIANSTTRAPIVSGVGDSLGKTYISTIANNGVSLATPAGPTPVMGTQNVSYSLNDGRDGAVVFNGSSLTATLPDPATVSRGRVFYVKNINTSALTVTTAATKTIDGAATQTLAQWGAGRYVSDGTQWLSL